jgi:hypothetical protein
LEGIFSSKINIKEIFYEVWRVVIFKITTLLFLCQKQRQLRKNRNFVREKSTHVQRLILAKEVAKLSNLFVCRGKRLCGFLISKGCECIKADVDKKNPDYMVYLFERTQKFSNAMDEWQRGELIYHK